MTAPDSSDPLAPLRALAAAGRWREALAWAEAPETGDHLRDRPDGFLLTATVATRLGAFDRAAEDASLALMDFERRADADGRMRTLNLLGAIAFERGRIEDAERYFEEAGTLAGRLGDTLLEARVCNNLASVAHLLGDSDRAVNLYRRAILAYQRLGDRRGAAETYHNLGMVFRLQGAWAEAEAATGHATRHAEQAAEAWLLGLTLAGRAELLIAEGDTSVARPLLETAERHARQGDDRLGVGEIERIRSYLALTAHDGQGALTHARTGATIGREMGAPLLEAECLAMAARAAAALERTEDTAAAVAEARARFTALGARRHLAELAEEFGG